MAPVRGRAYRPRGATSPIQGRIPPAVHDKARRAADAAGITISAYLEALIARDQVDESGCPVWLEPARSGQEELPLKSA